MSWLEDRDIQYVYLDEDGKELIIEYPAKEEPQDVVKFEGHVYTKSHMLPCKVNLTFKVQFERNGLVAYKIDSGDGKPRTVSATRLQWEKNIGNIPGDKLRKMQKEDPIRFRELSRSVTTKGYKQTFMKVHEKRIKGAK